jgi:predicted RNA binding protein YcfA (HicA-like mRNA interferase family)
MKKILLLIFFSQASIFMLQAQGNSTSDSSLIIALNQQIDNYVVLRNTTALDKLYANDFVFSHGSGLIEGKQGWFVSVAKGSFVTRRHDSVTVEMHPAIAVVRGKLSVHKKTEKEESKYHLKYVRVYALRNGQWQLISHVTVWEQHEAG